MTETVVTRPVRTTPVLITNAGDRVTIIQSASPIPAYGIGGGANYTHIQATAQDTWTIPHNLGRRPGVAVLDGEGRIIHADVQHLSDDVVSISFSVPVLGTAELT